MAIRAFKPGELNVAFARPRKPDEPKTYVTESLLLKHLPGKKVLLISSETNESEIKKTLEKITNDRTT